MNTAACPRESPGPAARGRFTWHPAKTAVGLTLTLLAILPAQTDPQQVTLKLEEATLDQAASALGRAARTPLVVPERLREARVAGGSSTRSSFAWTRTSFPQALRELCSRFGVVPLDGREGYILIPKPADWQSRFPDRIQEQEHRGLKMFLAHRSWGQGSRTIVNGEVSGGEPVLHLTFVVNLGNRSRDTMRGFRSLVARDDRGRVLRQLPSSGFPQRFFPDEWAHTVTLQGPAEGATRLVSLSGDLMVHGVSRRRSLEVDLLPQGKSSRPSEEGVVLEVPSPEAIPAGQENGPGFRIQASLRFPKNSPLTADGDSVSFQVLDAQGKPLPAAKQASGRQSRREGQYFEYTRKYGPTQARPARVRAAWREQSSEEPLFTFQMTEIPIPGRL